MPMDDLMEYKCPNCGGAIHFEATTQMMKCPYCNNPVVVTKQFSGTLRPDYVIPFFTTKEQVTAALKEHLKGKLLLPRAFRSQYKVENIKGVYVPFWLFDAEAAADIDFNATKVHTWSDAKYHYTRTEYYSVHRAGSLGFERVPVDGSSKMPDDYMESIEPYDYSQMVDFQTAYLAGFLADKYDEDAEKSAPRANSRIRNSTIDTFKSTVVGYATCTVQNANISVSQGNVRYALLPVWMMNTRYQDKNYLFAMNGQTGKFVGELPVSKGKYFAWLSGLTVGIGAVLTLLAYLFF